MCRQKQPEEMVHVYVLLCSVGRLSVLSLPALVSAVPREACSAFPSHVRFGHLLEPWLPFFSAGRWSDPLGPVELAGGYGFYRYIGPPIG